MALTLLPSHLELVKNIARSEGIKNYKLELSSGKQKGDGYLSNIVLVTLNSPEKTLKILFKIASDSVKLRLQTPVNKAFEREIFMYNEVFKHYANLQNDSQIPFATTKFYGYSLKEYEECLVFENLKENGFQLWNRKIPMNHEHIELIFRTYAKYHALSFITKYHYPNKYKEWVKKAGNISKYFFKENFVVQIKKLIDDIVVIFDDNNVKSKLHDLSDNWKDFFFPKCEEKYAVLIHGDSWCNNFLFKYENPANTTKPIDIRLLDFQIAMLTTPVQDLSYCLFSDTDKQCFSNYRLYLNLYHRAMADVLKSYNLDINTVYPYEILEEYWKKYARYGLLMGFFVQKGALVSTENAIDLGEEAENDCDIFESLMNSCPNSEEYYTKIKDLVQVFVDNNLL